MELRPNIHPYSPEKPSQELTEEEQQIIIDGSVAIENFIINYRREGATEEEKSWIKTEARKTLGKMTNKINRLDSSRIISEILNKVQPTIPEGFFDSNAPAIEKK